MQHHKQDTAEGDRKTNPSISRRQHIPEFGKDTVLV